MHSCNSRFTCYIIKNDALLLNERYGNNISHLLDCFLAVSFGIGTYHNVQLISVGGMGEKMLLPSHIPENVFYMLF